MQIPFTFNDFRLWITIVTIILLLTDQIASQAQDNIKLYINNKKLREMTTIAVLAFMIVFVITLFLQVVLG